MSILDVEGMVINGINGPKYSPIRNSMRDGLYAEQAKAVTDLYYKISELCIQFFNENYNEDSLDDTNKRMLEDLRKVIPTFAESVVFETKDQAVEAAEYVFTLPFPTTINRMKGLLHNVTIGKLRFMRDYPLDKSTIGYQVNSVNIFLIS